MSSRIPHNPEQCGGRPRADRQQEAAGLAIRLLIRRLGSIDAGSRERLIDLPLQQLQQLAEDLLDFTEPGDLQAWFDDHPAG